MFRQRGITFKLIASVLLSSAAVFAVIFGYNYQVSRRIIIGKIEESARYLAQATAQRIENVLRPIERVPRELAVVMEHAAPREPQMLAALQASVAANPDIFGSAIAFEPFFAPGKGRYYAPYYYRQGDETLLKYLGDDTYQYHSWEWYAVPRQCGKPVWTEPYYDEGGGQVIMSTYSVPFYQVRDGKRAFSGVATADVSLAWLQQLVGSMRIGKTGYGFIVSRKGIVVSHPRQELILSATVSSLPEYGNDPSWNEVARQMTTGRTGFARARNSVTGKACWVAYVPLESTGWSLGVLFPQDELMADVYVLNRVMLAIAVAGFVMLTLVIAVISGGITRPLRELAGAAHDIARGDLNCAPPVSRSGDEVGRLAESFRLMQGALKQYIEELKSTTAAKERIEGELRVAHDIQMSFLPKTFPPFPEKPEIDLHAVLVPAKEVGGDLYDFFFVDDHRLCFLIGDVSGKGVPASLFMAVTKTLIKTTAEQDPDPAHVLRRINATLVKENDACMFVTVFCGVLDIQTGEVLYSNGGHNGPFIIRQGGQVEMLNCSSGTAVGVMDNAQYQRERMVLDPGDTIVLYTDGVTEAVNAEQQMFSEYRLHDTLARNAEMPVKELIDCVLGDVQSFVRGAPQADDISLLALRFLPVPQAR